ncbi:MFS transporter [Streptomyces sp. L2]|uniref:MFS transporter n=1 Tax=Streptomyces sp. L2 TaxID=2162665 RepID=UPI0013E90251|nr:MFS transporter [Streptomyces sp. L2]
MPDNAIAPPEKRTSVVRVLRDPVFRFFFLGQSISAVGDAMVPVATAFAVLRISGSVTLLGLVLAVLWASRLAMAPVAGQIADRFDRVRVLVWSDLIRCAVQGVVAAALFSGRATIWELATGAAFYGAASALFGPASMGLLAETVDEEHRQRANALVAISQNFIVMLGPAFSGLLAAMGDYGVAYALDSASFLASAVFLTLLTRARSLGPRPAREQSGTHHEPGLTGEPVRSGAAQGSFLKREFARFREGVAVVNKHPWMWSSFLASAVTNVGTSAFFVLGPAATEARLGGAATWGLVGTSASLGGLLGGMVASRWHPRKPLVTGYLLMGLLIPAELVALASGGRVLLVLTSGTAIAGMVFGTVLLDTAIQSQVPEDSMARVDALDTFISTLPMPLGLLAAGPAADLIGMSHLLIGMAAATAVANLLVPLARGSRTYRNPAATAHPKEMELA